MASRQTKILGGSGTRTQSFTLDPGLFQYIESVLVQIDNTAGPDTSPTLTVSTVNDVPIADKTQGKVIPAGDASARASWALGLDDERTDSDPFLPVYAVFARMQGGQSFNSNTLGIISFTNVDYDHGGWINLGVDPTAFTVPETSYYTIEGQYEWNIPAAAGQRREVMISLAGDAVQNGLVAKENVPTINGIPTSQNISITRRFSAGATIKAIVLQASAGAFTIGSVGFSVTRVWKG